MKTASARHWRRWSSARAAVTILGLHFGGITTFAQPPAASGVLEGQVTRTGGGFLDKARVSIEGTRLQGLTDSEGRYRVAGVPDGVVMVRASSTGFDSKTATVTIVPDGAVRQDFELALRGDVVARSGELVEMEPYTVTEREMSAQMAALNEQRIAPNIKSVLAAGEFGNLGEGNLEDFLNLVPGMTPELSGNAAIGFSVRGVPPNNVLVTIDGSQVPSSLDVDTRAFNPRPIQLNNLDRIEITKVPTPDMPANAVGGSINVISKTGFDRRKPELSFKVYTTFNSDLDAPPQARRDLKANEIQPGFDFSYIRPLTPSLAITISGSTNTRYNNLGREVTSWNEVQGFLTAHNIQFEGHRLIKKTNGALGIDWKISPQDTLNFSFQYYDYRDAADEDGRLNVAFGNGATGDLTFTQGAANGVGTVTGQFANALQRWSKTPMFSLKYRHRGYVWSVDSQVSYSAAYGEDRNLEEGYFGGAGHSISNLVLRGDGVGSRYPDVVGPTRVSAVNRQGAPVDIFDARNFTLTNATAPRRDLATYRKEAKLNVGRDFAARIPFALRAGVSVEQEEKDNRVASLTWSFRPTASAADRLVGNYDILASERYPIKEYGTGFTAIDLNKLYDLYLQRPDYFVLDQPAAYQASVLGSKHIVETISAAYIRGDFKFINDRLRIVTGVRYERTEDKGQGPLNDPGALFARDANGVRIRNAQGQFIPLATDPLEQRKLQFRFREARAHSDYDGLFPSFNSTFAISENLLLRAAYARTIGRPNLNFIVPGITLSAPDATNPTITIVNTGLKPWTADNYDLSLESYLIKGGFGSVGVFQRNIDNVFGQIRSPDATLEKLAEFGLSDQYLDYDIVTRQNVGPARMKGIEFNYRQNLEVFHPWLKGVQVFFNTTAVSSRASPEPADFYSNRGLNPRVVNWGVNFVQPRYAVRLNWSQYKDIRRTNVGASATIPPGTFNYIPARTVMGGNLEIRLTRHYTLEASARNILDAPVFYVDRAPGGRDYPTLWNWFGTDYTVGIRGRF